MTEAILNSPLGIGEGFGYSVAIHGNYTVVGTGTNNVFVYELIDSRWTLNSQLIPPPGNTHFGHTVAIASDFMVVGAESVGGSEGEVFIYKLNATTPLHNSWYLNGTLKSVDGFSSYFGHTVDISEGTIVVGAKGYEPLVYNSRGNREFILMFTVLSLLSFILYPLRNRQQLWMGVHLRL
jgi:hypothetical protein